MQNGFHSDSSSFVIENLRYIQLHMSGYFYVSLFLFTQAQLLACSHLFGYMNRDVVCVCVCVYRVGGWEVIHCLWLAAVCFYWAKLQRKRWLAHSMLGPVAAWRMRANMWTSVYFQHHTHLCACVCARLRVCIHTYDKINTLSWSKKNKKEEHGMHRPYQHHTGLTTPQLINWTHFYVYNSTYATASLMYQRYLHCHRL